MSFPDLSTMSEDKLLELLLGPKRGPSTFERHGRDLIRVVREARASYRQEDLKIQASLEVARRAALHAVVGTKVGSPRVLIDYLLTRFAGQPYETFVMVWLDAQNCVLSAEEMFRGTVTQTSVYPREIVKRALEVNAAAAVAAHNHPSNDPEPSRADELLTSAVKSALALIDCRLLDHVVIGGGRGVSLAERGLL